MKKYINPRNLLLFGLVLVVVAFFWLRKQSEFFEDDVPDESPESPDDPQDETPGETLAADLKNNPDE